MNLCQFEATRPGHLRCTACGRELATLQPPHRVKATCRAGRGAPATGPARRTPCLHQGPELRRETCRTCTGSVKLKVFACRALGGECTIQRPLASAAHCCATCPSWAPLPTSQPESDDLRIDTAKSSLVPLNVAPPPPANSVAIVILCHNYARFLPAAIDSALIQTAPREILVVDIQSSDDTSAVAARYESSGVRALRIESTSPRAAQIAGVAATSAPFLCFLDADDALPPDYLERGLPAFADPAVGIVYSDMELFGSERGVDRFQEPGAVQLERRNQCHAGSLVRRAALDSSGALDPAIEISGWQLQDWLLWRLVTRAGWKLAKSPALYRYRRHGQSWLPKAAAAGATYFEAAALALEPITLFIALSGREWAWPRLWEFLEAQGWPKAQTRLVLCDTSGDDGFGRMVRRWLAVCDYPDARYYRQRVGRPGLADLDRRDVAIRRQVQSAMPRIYNRLAQEATTEYVWVIEDDVIPPADTAERLLRSFAEDVVSVAGAYRSRYHGGYLAWDARDRIFVDRDVPIGPDLPGRPATVLIPEPRRPLEVGGNGFGCVIVRRSSLRETVFQDAVPTFDFDPNFYKSLPRAGSAGNGRPFRALVDFRIVCDHLQES